MPGHQSATYRCRSSPHSAQGTSRWPIASDASTFTRRAGYVSRLFYHPLNFIFGTRLRRLLIAAGLAGNSFGSPQASLCIRHVVNRFNSSRAEFVSLDRYDNAPRDVKNYPPGTPKILFQGTPGIITRRT